MGMVTEFRDFAMRGNVIDLAVGVVIGGAFGKIVGSLVEKVIMPPIGLLIGGVDFSDIAITLREAVGETPAVAIGIGDFINTLIQFVIVAFAIFMVIKAINATKRKQEAAPPPPPSEPSEEVRLLTEIRDALRNR
jgi:large conductance mechanosensitive channel